jgi:arylsulfatase A-like enzyme
MGLSWTLRHCACSRNGILRATAPLAGAGGGSNGPWRGNFFTPPYEGSYRMSAMVCRPDHIAVGRQSQEMLTAVDWLPTLAGLVGESKQVRWPQFVRQSEPLVKV